MPAIPRPPLAVPSPVAVLRPVSPDRAGRPSLTVVIPARTSAGNIEAAASADAEFRRGNRGDVREGNSNDGTWEEIQRVERLWDGRQGLRVRALQQQAKGKATPCGWVSRRRRARC
jgi:hypothetical protein